MKEKTKWEVIWSRNQPLIVYRRGKVFKIFKVKVEDEFFITTPISGKFPHDTYEKIKETLCKKYDLDTSACDQIRALYHEFFEDT